MKIIVTASSPSFDAAFDPRFGRGAYFIAVDSDTLQWEAFPNPGVNTTGGAGIQAAQFIVELKANALISGSFGPNAFSALKAAGVAMYLNKAAGSVSDAVQQFKSGNLQQADESMIAGSHHGRGA